jgi:Terminase RNaseH-like domain
LARCRRVVVAVDPSGAASREDEAADEIGIVVAARGDDGHAYVLADRSLRDAPGVWGRAAVRAYHEFKADRIVAEENFGGEMVRFVIRAADQNIRVEMVSASRGKVLRAEPVSALYEHGMVHHVGRFAVLEDQLVAFTTQDYVGEGSPDHADALVFAVTELMLKENAALLEYYRARAAAHERPPVQIKAGTVETAVRLRVLPGVSAVYGRSGTLYVAGADGVVTTVQPDDAPPLISAGFTRADDGFVVAHEHEKPALLIKPRSLLWLKRPFLLGSTYLTDKVLRHLVVRLD